MKIRRYHYCFSLLEGAILQNVDKLAVPERVERCVGPDFHGPLKLKNIWVVVKDVFFWVLGWLLWAY